MNLRSKSMNIREFHAVVIQGAGPLARLQPARSARLVDQIIECWPEADAALAIDRTTLACDVANSVGRRSRREHGFSPVALLILGGIINFLIEWYFSDPAEHSQLIAQLRRAKLSDRPAAHEVECQGLLLP